MTIILVGIYGLCGVSGKKTINFFNLSSIMENVPFTDYIFSARSIKSATP
jgi:hypothetical protein